MLRWEKRVLGFISNHLYTIAVVVITLISLLMRYIMRNYESGDMQVYLLSWFEEIKTNGGLLALRNQIGNYNIPYQTLIALLTYLPIKPLYLYKISSSLFDYLVGITASMIMWQISKDKLRACVVYLMIIILPTVVFNSSMWGQCDSIYTFFCLLSFYMITQKKYSFGFLAYGAAFAFKLQAVFFLPFLMLYYVCEKRFSILQFLWIPVAMILLSLGGLLQGRNLSSIVEIYIGQTGGGPMISNFYPSFWNLMIGNGVLNEDMLRYCIFVTIVILALYMLVILTKKEHGAVISEQSMLRIAFLMSYTCVLFLPSMHERYGYLHVVMAVIIALMELKTIPAFVLLLAIDMQTYGRYLFLPFETLPWTVLAIANTFCYVYYLINSLIHMNSSINMVSIVDKG